MYTFEERMKQLQDVGLVSAVMGIICYALLYAAQIKVPNEADLIELTGHLAKPVVTIHKSGKGAPSAKVEIKTAEGWIEGGQIPYLCFLWEGCEPPQNISTLRAGDKITVWLASPHWLQGEVKFVWRIAQNNTDLLLFRDTAAAYAAQHVRYQYIGGGFSLIGLLVAAIAWSIRRSHSTKQGSPGIRDNS